MADKKCIRCGRVKNVTEYTKNSKSKDGFIHTCGTCYSEIKASRGSLRKAINDKCKECIYDPIGGEGTWVQQVRECTSGTCPLFEVRPGA